jgi:hypothetical protein
LDDRQTNRLLADFVAEQAWIDLSFQPFCELGRELLHDLKRTMIKTNAAIKPVSPRVRIV